MEALNLLGEEVGTDAIRAKQLISLDLGCTVENHAVVFDDWVRADVLEHLGEAGVD